MIGTGIFVAPADVARNSTSALEMCAIWLLGAVLSMLGALSFSEAASAMPTTGGMMVYLERGLGRWAAYAFGWAMLTVLVPSSVGYFAQIASQYFVPVSSWFAHPWAKSALVLLVLGANLRGVLTGARFQDALTMVKLVGVTAVALIAGVCALKGGMPFTHAVAPTASWSIAHFAVGLVGVLWAYDGWIDVTSVAGEVREPQKTLPFSLIVGTSLVAALYLLVNLGFIAAFGHSELGLHTTPAVDIGVNLFGPSGASLIGVIVGLAALGACAVGFMSGVRVVYASAKRKMLFAPLAKVSSRGVPANALVACAVLAVLYQQSPVSRLGELFILGAWPFYALGAIAVLRMKRRGDFSSNASTLSSIPSGAQGYREPEMAKSSSGFVTPWFPWPQRIFATVAALIVLMYTVREPRYTGISFAVISVGFVWWPWFRMQAKADKT